MPPVKKIQQIIPFASSYSLTSTSKIIILPYANSFFFISSPQNPYVTIQQNTHQDQQITMLILKSDNLHLFPTFTNRSLKIRYIKEDMYLKKQNH